MFHEVFYFLCVFQITKWAEIDNEETNDNNSDEIVVNMDESNDDEIDQTGIEDDASTLVSILFIFFWGGGGRWSGLWLVFLVLFFFCYGTVEWFMADDPGFHTIASLSDFLYLISISCV